MLPDRGQSGGAKTTREPAAKASTRRAPAMRACRGGTGGGFAIHAGGSLEKAPGREPVCRMKSLPSSGRASMVVDRDLSNVGRSRYSRIYLLGWNGPGAGS